MDDKELFSDINKDVLFYCKNERRNIIPVTNKEINEKAKSRLKEIFEKYKDDLPKSIINNWNRVKLFDASGDVDGAHALMIETDKGSYDINNKINHLTGKEWTVFSCSWFIFNALNKDLKEERAICGDSEDHPATYSPTMMENFIKFFTKEGMSVLDPFMGIGSTLVGCKRSGRIGYGIELNQKYYNTALKRVPKFRKNIICGDSRKVKEYFKGKIFDFSISSPPYWDVLNRSTGSFEKERSSKGLDVKYSSNNIDLGNISDYDKFLNDVTSIYLDIYDLLRDGAYLVIIVKNVKKGGKFYPLAWDIAKRLSEKYSLKDEKIWIQDKIGLAPYGYPHVWTANILHHYCLILRKEEKND
ncbi:MAG: DNA methyltransferase [Elusimicrobiota bacterium]